MSRSSETGSLTLWNAPGSLPTVARVAVIGDFLPAWKVAAEQRPMTTPAHWPQKAKDLELCLNDTSISVVNCECPLDCAGLEARPLNGLGDIVSAPSECLDYLTGIRANIVGIANNHSYDFGAEGVERTRRAIADHGCTPLGAGCTLADAPEIFVWQGPGRIRVGFWAAARATTNPSKRNLAGVEPATLRHARKALRAMKEQNASCCVALLHAGCLRASHPAPEDMEAIDSLAHAGFDIVAASHSHRISGAKMISRCDEQPAFCFYGLGTIVSGFAASAVEREGLIAVASLDQEGHLARIEVRVVLLEENGFGAVPSTTNASIILDRFRRLSAHIDDGSCAERFYQEISPGLLRLYVRDARRAVEQGGVRGLARKAWRVRMRHVVRLLHSVLS